MLLVALVHLFFGYKQRYSKYLWTIAMNFYGRVQSDKMKKLNFSGNLGLLRWANERKNTITVLACPDLGADYDPEALG